jgi:hypothetical protein
MCSSMFGWQTPKPRYINKFADPTLQDVFVSEKVVTSDKRSVDSLFDIAREARGKDRTDRIKAACIYLHFAQGEHRPSELSQAECFHRAANELRELDILDHAAQCYLSAAAVAMAEAPNKKYPSDEKERRRVEEALTLALRSAGRAKAQYAAIGVDALADEAHRLKQEVVRKRYSLDSNPLRAIFWIWRVVTGYGTSVRLWFFWLSVSLVVFALSYGILYYSGSIILANNAKFTSIVTPVYLAVMNLVTFGAYTQIVPNHWIAEVILVTQALSSFVLVGTGVTFLARR